MAVLITGTAGFIGFHLAKNLLENGQDVIGLDNINDYYSVKLKEDRTQILSQYAKFKFYKTDLCDLPGLVTIFKENDIQKVVNLAAQAGVRYSLTNPFAYQKSNLEGFINIIETSKNFKVENFLYASSSSVYGNNTKLPFSTTDHVDHPISLYAATKKANELIAHTYSHLFGLPTSGFRFFTVYGPYGRPDMALFIFTRKILAGEIIDVYNFGDMKRDFTYVDDICAGLMSSLDKPFAYEIFNLGNHRTENLMDFIGIIEKTLQLKAKVNLLPIQPGDVPETFADIDHTTLKLGYLPTTRIETGIKNFIDWYKEYYKNDLP
ncbi:MAG: GDP-mannose 4,6-dehydratase [Candidatus Marinimicrobia bacterium]|nr:GDP-mannose 4,6-dehydratase [Candidatus Neomarinimicrobiota bacterium]